VNWLSSFETIERCQLQLQQTSFLILDKFVCTLSLIK